MQSVRSASLAGKASRSASEATSTVSIPSRRQVLMIRTAISPRLAISTRRICTGLTRPDDAQQWLAVLNQSAVPRQDFADAAAGAGPNGVHELHHFDDADDGRLLYLRADFHEGGSAGFGRAIKRAEERCANAVQPRILRGGRSAGRVRV